MYFWLTFAEPQAEKIWDNVQLMIQLDTTSNKAAGCAGDGFA